MRADEIRKACKFLRISQRELAKLLNVDKNTVSRWANGQSNIPYLAELEINKMISEREEIKKGADTGLI